MSSKIEQTFEKMTKYVLSSLDKKCFMWILLIKKKVDKPKGGGGSNKVDNVSMWNLGLFWCYFLGICNEDLVVFSLYLAITKQKKKIYIFW